MALHLMGAVIGDISGSWYEFRDFKERPEQLVTQRDFFTDDSVLTIAVARGMIDAFQTVDRALLPQSPDAQRQVKEEVTQSLWQFAQRYPDRGYGNTFIRWYTDAANGLGAAPYNSWGNGSAHAGFLRRMGRQLPGRGTAAGSALCRGDPQPPGGLKGAQAVAAACTCFAAARTRPQCRPTSPVSTT